MTWPSEGSAEELVFDSPGIVITFRSSLSRVSSHSSVVHGQSRRQSAGEQQKCSLVGHGKIARFGGVDTENSVSAVTDRDRNGDVASVRGPPRIDAPAGLLPCHVLDQ